MSIRTLEGVIHVLPTEKQSIAANKPAAIRKALMAEMRASLGPLLVVCEAIGGYERHVVEVCEELGIAAHKTHESREPACIAGLAPINNDSGAFQGLRHIQAGRAAVRKTLYMAAFVAMQHNPVMRLFANKLRRNGKPSKVVITTLMRKLIVTLNAILRSGEPWSHAKIA
jgi:transposase